MRNTRIFITHSPDAAVIGRTMRARRLGEAGQAWLHAGRQRWVSEAERARMPPNVPVLAAEQRDLQPALAR